MNLRTRLNLSLVIQCLLGLSWILWILWVRLFQEHLPRTWPELLDLPLWRTSYLSLLFLVLEIFALHQLFWPIAKKSPLSWALERLPGRKYLEYVVRSPAMIFPYVLNQLSPEKAKYVTYMLVWFMEFLGRYGGKGYYAWILPIIVALLPLWILGLIFCWEILVLERLKYFYLFFPLFLIPLVGRAMLSMGAQMCWINISTIDRFIQVTQLSSRVYDFQPRKPLAPDNFQELVRIYKICLEFSEHERLLDGVKNYFFRRSAPLLWALYLSGWTWILFHQILYLIVGGIIWP